MNATPPSYDPIRQNRSPTTVIVVILAIIAVVCCLGGVGGAFLGYRFMKGTAFPLAGCLVSFQDVQSAMGKYASGHGGKLPKAETWQDDVKSYYADIIREHAGREGPIEIMKPEGDWGCMIGGEQNKTGMAFNSDLSGKELSKVPYAYGAVLLFEIEKPRHNAAEPYKPRDPMSSPKLFGSPRGWVVAPLSGAVRMESPNGSNFRGQTDWNPSQKSGSK